MSFTYELTNDVGKLRLKIGDSIVNLGPRPSRANFSDEELQHFLDTEATEGRAMAAVFDTLAAEWSSFTNITLGPRKEEFAKIAEAWARRAKDARVQYGGGSSFSTAFERRDGYHKAATGESEFSDAANSEFS
jgi:hypothetical protein